MSKTKPVITAFAASPDEGRGLARDMRIRWALEEVGLPYDVCLLSFQELKAPDHRRRHPFGQIPTYEEGGLILFESGAVILHLAERHPGLLPADADAKARAITWLFAALSTLEPPIVEIEAAAYTERDQPWFEERHRMLKDRARTRLQDLASWLGDRSWLEDEFTAGDLMMVMVLRRLEDSGLLEEFPTLADYVGRGEARPAYQRAFADQLAVFQALRDRPPA